MPMTTFKVPKGFKPTPAIVKANPTVKQFSTGQIINVPTRDAREGFRPVIQQPYARQASYTNYVNQAFAGTPPTTTGGSVIDSYMPKPFTVAPLFGTPNKPVAPIIPTGSFLAANGTIAQGAAGVNYQTVAPQPQAAPVQAPVQQTGPQFSADNWEAQKQAFRFYAGRDAKRWWVGGKGGGGGGKAQTSAAGNAVNTGVNWRIG
jgi:hypothetical protein